jgi:hypothetical protein
MIGYKLIIDLILLVREIKGDILEVIRKLY